jgi:hypothetical protein
LRYFYFLVLVLIGYDYYKNVIATTNEVKERPFLDFYISACSNSVQLVPLHPIIISILFHHYKELKECISEVELIESIRVADNSSGKKKEGLLIKEEEKGEEKELIQMQEMPPPATLNAYMEEGGEDTSST